MIPVTDSYLDALGARVTRGRLFSAADTATSTPSAVSFTAVVAPFTALGQWAIFPCPASLALGSASFIVITPAYHVQRMAVYASPC